MGTAFSSSLFGLAGALVLGFLDLQAGHAENRFFKELEDWLAELTHLPSGLLTEGETTIPAYVEALLDKTADSLEGLERIDLYQFHTPDPKVPFADSFRNNFV